MPEEYAMSRKDKKDLDLIFVWCAIKNEGVYKKNVEVVFGVDEPCEGWDTFWMEEKGYSLARVEMQIVDAMTFEETLKHKLNSLLERA